jgi:aminobenzoyl-glutamate utilization protein B
MIMLNAVEMLREHLPRDTRVHYVITNGGAAANIVPAFAEVSLVARHPDAQTLNGVWDRILKCAQAGALASETRMEFQQGTNYANRLPNDVLAEVLARAMQKAGGYQYSPEELQFAAELVKTLPDTPVVPTGRTVRTDRSTPMTMASTDSGDVSWNVPTHSIVAATFVPGVAAHTWQAAACAGTSIGRKGMLVAARTLSLGAIELLENPGQVKAARLAFEKRLAGRKWVTRIAPESKPRLNYASK